MIRVQYNNGEPEAKVKEMRFSSGHFEGQASGSSYFFTGLIKTKPFAVCCRYSEERLLEGMGDLNPNYRGNSGNA